MILQDELGQVSTGIRRSKHRVKLPIPIQMHLLEIRAFLMAKGMVLTPAQTIEFVIAVWNTTLPTPNNALQIMSLEGIEYEYYQISAISYIRLQQMYLESDEKLGLPKYGASIAVAQMIYSYYVSIVTKEIPAIALFLKRLTYYRKAYEKVTDEIAKEQLRKNTSIKRLAPVGKYQEVYKRQEEKEDIV